MHLHRSKINLAPKPYETAQVTGLNFMNWYLYGKDNGEMDSKIFQGKDTAWLKLLAPKFYF
jgi:hypothetical protein